MTRTTDSGNNTHHRRSTSQKSARKKKTWKRMSNPDRPWDGWHLIIISFQFERSVCWFGGGTYRPMLLLQAKNTTCPINHRGRLLNPASKPKVHYVILDFPVRIIGKSLMSANEASFLIGWLCSNHARLSLILFVFGFETNAQILPLGRCPRSKYSSYIYELPMLP